MRYHNGVLRVEQDSTLRLRQIAKKKNLTWMEYCPLIILCGLIAGLLVKGIYHG